LRQAHIAGVGDLTLTRPLSDVLEIDLDQCGQVLALIAEHDHLADERAAAQCVLDRGRGDVLAAAGNQDVLLAIDYPEGAALEHGGDVSGMHEPGVIEQRAGRSLVVPVADDVARAAQAQLSVLRDADRARGHWRDRRIGRRPGAGLRTDTTSLGHAEHVAERDAPGFYGLVDRRRQRSATEARPGSI